MRIKTSRVLGVKPAGSLRLNGREISDASEEQREDETSPTLIESVFLGAMRRSKKVVDEQYLVTICKHRVKDTVTEQELNKIKYYLQRVHKVKFLEYATEQHGRYKQLHSHSLVHFNKSYKGLTSYKGFRIYWKKVDGSTFKVKQYIYKNKK